MITLCECGCGMPAPINPVNCRSRGLVRGMPMRFIHGHHSRVSPGCKSSRFSPGMVSSKKRHGMTDTPEYAAYENARTRCTNPNIKDWKHYGGRGIKFLFINFEQWFAELGPRPTPKHSVDRWPNMNGHYEPGNVRWATTSEQVKNRRPFSEEAKRRMSEAHRQL